MTHVNVFSKKPDIIFSAGAGITRTCRPFHDNIVHGNRSQAIAFYSYLNYMIKLKSGIETT